MKFTTGGILGVCYGICMSLGLAICFDFNWLAGCLIGTACGGLGSMIGDIWSEVTVMRADREEQETETLGEMLAEADKRRR